VDEVGSSVDELLTLNDDVGVDDAIVGEDGSRPRITVPTGMVKVDELLLQQPKPQQ
jgi:hypothetical protein